MFGNRSITTRTFTAALLSLACSVFALPAAAQDWRKEIVATDASLRTANYGQSLDSIDLVISRMVDRFGGSKEENELFATALTRKALAEAGLGNIDDSLWYWCIAQEIWPDVAKTDWTPFGAPGEFLKRHPLASPDASVGGRFTPPHPVKEVAPKFPQGASRFGIGGDLAVQVVIDKSGQPTLPRIVHALPAPTLSFVALEALRKWHFEPATLDGQPVSAVFDLQVHYRL